MDNTPTITVGELLDKLENFDRNTEVSFSGLKFETIKWQSDKCIQIQFHEQVYRDASGKVWVENLEE